MSKTWKFAGINFDHMHMGDLLRQVHEHPNAEIVGICDADPARMEETRQKFSIPMDRVYTDVDTCLRESGADVAILCPATAKHADYVEQVAPHGVHVLVEKPFAATLAEADRMIAAMKPSGKQMLINWPLRWYPPHVTTKRLISEGKIGDVLEVHYYDGNRGPLRHGADKVEKEPTKKAGHWWYQREHGGGSLLDYLGYGVTLGTWYHDGEAPIEISCLCDDPEGLEVDEHSITIARYAKGLSKFETRWGTFTDPWSHQPQPKCGFVIVGTKGTISSYDFENSVRVQTPEHPEGEEIPVDVLEAPERNPVEYFVDRLERNLPPEGPLSPDLCRIGQQMVDTAFRSAQEKRALPLIS